MWGAAPFINLRSEKIIKKSFITIADSITDFVEYCLTEWTENVYNMLNSNNNHYVAIMILCIQLLGDKINKDGVGLMTIRTANHLLMPARIMNMSLICYCR